MRSLKSLTWVKVAFVSNIFVSGVNPDAAFYRNDLSPATSDCGDRSAPILFAYLIRRLHMLLSSLQITRDEFEVGTGWQLKAEGACKGDICIPLPAGNEETINVSAVAEAMQMPLAGEPEKGIWSLGPPSIGSRTLVTAKAPELDLPDLDGSIFKLSSLIGKKVLVYAWAPY